MVILIGCYFPTTLYAQDTITFNSFDEAIDSVFGDIDTNFYPSGILLNRAPYDENMLLANGQPGTLVIGTYDWLFYYQNIREASRRRYLTQPMEQLYTYGRDEVYQRRRAYLAVLNFKAQFIKDVGFSNGDVTFSNRQLHVSNPAAFETRRIFSVACLSEVVAGPDVSFFLTDEMIFTNDGNNPISITADFGDGNGVVPVALNQEILIHYPNVGTKYIEVTFNYSGYSLKSKSQVEVKDADINRDICIFPWEAITNPVEPMTFGPELISTTEVPIPNGESGDKITGEYAIWHGCGNGTTLRKPIIISAGFNPGDGKQLLPCIFNDGTPGSFMWNGEWRGTYYETYNGAFNENMSPGTITGDNNGTNFLQRLREEGYDIIILMYHHGTDYAQNHASLMTTLIKRVNQELEANGSKHEIVVMGYSIGAVATRYALAKMENDYQLHKNTPQSSQYPPHRCRTWVSIDGEHQASNVPIGFQHGLHHWCTTEAVDVGDILGQLTSRLALNMINSPTSLQLTNPHHTATSGQVMNMTQARITLLNNLAALTPGITDPVIKGYPQYCRRVGVSQGSSVGSTTFGISAGQKFLEIYRTSPPALPISYYRSVDCWFQNAASGSPVMRREVGVKLFYGAWVIEGISVNDQNFIINNENMLDNCPASMLSPIVEYHGIPGLVYINTSGWGDSYSNLRKNNAFVPTVSGLDMHDPFTGNMLYATNAGLTANVSDFNLFYLNSSAEHPSFQYGFPFHSSPGDPYNVTPYDAVWAVGSTFTGLDRNQFHVEDPPLDMGRFLANVELAPVNLFLSDQTIHDYGDLQRTYRAAFEARFTITAGYDIYAENLIEINSVNYVHELTPKGKFIVEDHTDVDMRAGNEIIFKPGVEILSGSKFHAYIEPFPGSCPNNLRTATTHAPSTTAGSGSMESTEQPLESIHIYPNPNSGQFTVQLNSPLAGNANVEIFDMSGKLMLVVNVQLLEGQNYLPVQAQDIAPGIYYARVSGFDEVKKVIISR